MRSPLLPAAVKAEVERAFHSASGMMLCSGYISSGTSASPLYGGIRRLLSAVSLASSAESQKRMTR